MLLIPRQAGIALGPLGPSGYISSKPLCNTWLNIGPTPSYAERLFFQRHTSGTPSSVTGRPLPGACFPSAPRAADVRLRGGFVRFRALGGVLIWSCDFKQWGAAPAGNAAQRLANDGPVSWTLAQHYPDIDSESGVSGSDPAGPQVRPVSLYDPCWDTSLYLSVCGPHV